MVVWRLHLTKDVHDLFCTEKRKAYIGDFRKINIGDDKYSSGVFRISPDTTIKFGVSADSKRKLLGDPLAVYDNPSGYALDYQSLGLMLFFSADHLNLISIRFPEVGSGEVLAGKAFESVRIGIFEFSSGTTLAHFFSRKELNPSVESFRERTAVLELRFVLDASTIVRLNFWKTDDLPVASIDLLEK